MNQKLIIEAYKSIEYKGGEKLGSITVQINPDSYKLSKSTSYKKDESIKEDKQLPEYKHTNPSTLSFDIHFDGTGIIPTGKKTVTERIKDLENIIFLPSAEIDPPSPCFLKVIWGSLIFKGRLTSLNWDYTLFSPNGNPLRAKGSLSLTEAISSRETQAKKKGNYILLYTITKIIKGHITMYPFIIQSFFSFFFPFPSFLTLQERVFRKRGSRGSIFGL